MPDLPLTKSAIEALPSPEKNAVDYRDQKQRALWLRVSPAGTKSWCVRYKREGKSQRENIGRFPDLTITFAREKAAAVLTSLAKGVDLPAERKARRAAEERKALETLQAVGEAYFERAPHGRHRMNGKPKRPGSVKMERLYFDRFLVPRLGSQRLVDLTRADLQVQMDEIGNEASLSSARHSRNVLHRIYAFAMWQDIVTTDPTRFVATTDAGQRERVLSDHEIRALWRLLDNAAATTDVTISPSMVYAIKLAAVTLQRRGEIVGMTVDEVDFEKHHWTIPGARTKNGRTHIVPLSNMAAGLIESAIAARVGKARGSAFVFPSPRDATRPMRSVALNVAWYRCVVPQKTRIAANGELRITPHDLRRTGATAITSERIGMPRFVVSQVLNHTSDSGGTAAVTAVYDRNAYMREKRAALDAWAALLQEIVDGKARPNNLVQFAR